MTHRRPPRGPAPRSRIRPLRAAGLLVSIALIALALGERMPASSSPAASLPAPIGGAHADPPPPRSLHPKGDVANLDRALVGALRRAAADAADAGIEIHVRSGRRSPEHQAQLLREAIAKYGSEQEAARWVATPETSPHVSGDAVDVGPSAAAAWLSERGARYGLCQIYANEPWHYELRPQAVGHGCPPTYPDPTHDPRMQR